MDVMVDIETLSTRGHATILVLAAIKFDRSNDTIPLEKCDTFYAKITVNSCKELGLDIDEKTIKWWDSQESSIRREVFSEPREDLKTVLQNFTKWFAKSQNVWSHGASFDIPILSEAYIRCGLETPWKFWMARDTRTIFDLAGIENKDLPQDKKHHALFDCWRQISGVKMALKKLKK